MAELRRRYALLTPREREVLPFVVAGLLTSRPLPNLATVRLPFRFIVDRSCAKWLPHPWQIWSKCRKTGDFLIC